MDRFVSYETSLNDLRERLIRVLGSPTVDALINRAVIEIGHAYPGLTPLHLEGDQLKFDGVRTALAGAEDDELRDAFLALDGVLVLLVARLLGREIAERLTGGLNMAGYTRGGRVIE